MNSRRELLTTLGAITLAGCTSESSEQGNSQPENTGNNEEPDRELSVPFDGLGAYEEALNEANGLNESDDVTPSQIQNILEGSDTVQEEAEQLAEITYISDAHSVLQEYHLQKTDSENTVVGNINWSFTSDSEPILELHTVQNGQLQGQPIISDTSQGSITTHKPNDGPNPQYLKGIRNDDNAASSVPQDYDGFEEFVEDIVDDQEDYTRREARETTFNKWSNALFGVEGEPDLIPHNAESSNVVFDGLYHGENTEAVVQLNQQYAESEHFRSDEVVSAKYTGEGWEFEVQEDYEMGDELPAHQ